MGNRGCFDDRPEAQPLSGDMDFQRRRTLQASLDQCFRQRIFHVPLQCPSQRPRPVAAIAAGLVENPLTRFRSQDNLHLSMYQGVVDLANEEVDDAQEIVIAERIEENDLIETIQKFGIEYAL